MNNKIKITLITFLIIVSIILPTLSQSETKQIEKSNDNSLLKSSKDRLDGILENTIEAHEEWVNIVAFNPNGTLLASGGCDKTRENIEVACTLGFIKIWDFTTKKLVRTLRGHKKWIRSLSFSPDGKILASGGCEKDDPYGYATCYYGLVKLWDSNTGKILRTLNAHKDVPMSLAFSPDGRILASGSFDKTIKLWSVSTGKNIRTINGNDEGVSSVTFSPNGKILASGGCEEVIEDESESVCTNGLVKLWNVSNGNILKTLIGHSGDVFSLSFNPDGSLLASGSEDGKIKIWDVKTGLELTTLRGHSSDVMSISFSLNGKYLASGSCDSTIKLWDVSTGEELATLKGHSNEVWAVAFHPIEQLLVSGSWDGTIKVWK